MMTHSKNVLGLAAVAATFWLLSRSRWVKRTGSQRFTRILHAFDLRPVPDAAVEGRVQSCLRRAAPRTEISATTEHGCVMLTGDVATRERAGIVKRVARVRGVDSVIDLMHEPAP
ncbi:MAG: BON domain-containing protein [Polyangiaceae bacterium]|nr:BON domain-containing protein [Polyangiaceae bacterium]